MGPILCKKETDIFKIRYQFSGGSRWKSGLTLRRRKLERIGRKNPRLTERKNVLGFCSHAYMGTFVLGLVAAWEVSSRYHIWEASSQYYSINTVLLNRIRLRTRHLRFQSSLKVSIESVSGLV